MLLIQLLQLVMSVAAKRALASRWMAPRSVPSLYPSSSSWSLSRFIPIERQFVLLPGFLRVPPGVKVSADTVGP